MSVEVLVYSCIWVLECPRIRRVCEYKKGSDGPCWPSRSFQHPRFNGWMIAGIGMRRTTIINYCGDFENSRQSDQFRLFSLQCPFVCTELKVLIRDSSGPWLAWLIGYSVSSVWSSSSDINVCNAYQTRLTKWSCLGMTRLLLALGGCIFIFMFMPSV